MKAQNSLPGTARFSLRPIASLRSLALGAVAATMLVGGMPPAASAMLDLCPDEPLEGCLSAGKTTVRITNPRNAERRRLTVRFNNAEAARKPLFGDPSEDTGYAVCIYDYASGMPGLAYVAELPASPDWTEPINTPGWRYDDFLGENHGFIFGRLVPSRTSGRSKVSLRAREENVPEVVPFSSSRMMAIDQQLDAQVVNTLGTCWSGTVFGSEVNRKRSFKATGY